MGSVPAELPGGNQQQHQTHTAEQNHLGQDLGDKPAAIDDHDVMAEPLRLLQ